MQKTVRESIKGNYLKNQLESCGIKNDLIRSFFKKVALQNQPDI